MHFFQGKAPVGIWLLPNKVIGLDVRRPVAHRDADTVPTSVPVQGEGNELTVSHLIRMITGMLIPGSGS